MKIILRKAKVMEWISSIPGIFYIMIALLVLFSIVSKDFFSLGNFFNIIRQGSVLVIVALGMLVVITGGGIDLSVGALLGLTGTVVAYLLQIGVSLPISVILGIVTCSISGLISGLIISKGKIFPFIVTFGMLFMAQGISLGITKAGSIHIGNLPFIDFGSNLFGGVPAALWVMLFVIVIIAVILRLTLFGYYIYAIGFDIESAKAIGINVDLYIILKYVISGTLAGVAGIILASRVATGNALIGIGTEFEAIAAVVIGGTPITGGRGSIAGAIFGALVIIILRSGLTFLGISSELISVIIGISIMAAVVGAQLLYRGGLYEKS
jgi:ribose transport system permease protein